MIFIHSVSLVDEACVTCGIVFAMPAVFREARKVDKKSFYCPGGHAMSYTRTTEDELRETLAAAERDRDVLRTRRDQCEVEKARLLRRLARAQRRAR